jgi:hypothetical protein
MTRVALTSDQAPEMLPGEVWPISTRSELALTSDGFRFYLDGRPVTHGFSREVLARLGGAIAAALEMYDDIHEEGRAA